MVEKVNYLIRFGFFFITLDSSWIVQFSALKSRSSIFLSSGRKHF